MIVLIRKWIAWLLVAVIIAGASAYWCADTFGGSTDAESVQVMSYQKNISLAPEEEKTAEPSGDPAENIEEAANSDNETDEGNITSTSETDVAEDDWQKKAEELKWQRKNELDAEYDELKSMAETAVNAEVRTQAEKRMLEIKNAQKIAEQAENMLKLKGYEAAVFIEGEQISALIDKNLPVEEGIVIAEILERISGFNKENVLVIPR